MKIIDRDYMEGVHEQSVASRTQAESADRLRRLYPWYFKELAATPDMEDRYGPVCAEYLGDFESVTMQSEGRDNAA